MEFKTYSELKFLVDGAGNTFCTIAWLVTSAMLVAVPCLQLYYSHEANKLSLSNLPPWKQTLYGEVKESKMKLLYETWEVLVKVFIITMVVHVDFQPFLQLSSIFFVIQAMTFYLLHFRPLKESSRNNLLIFDQLTVFVILYPFILIANMSLDISIKPSIGWIIITVVCLNITANLVLAFYE